MKKILAVLAFVAMSLGMGGTAFASSYAGTVPTKVKVVHAKIRNHHSAQVHIGPKSGSAKPLGKVVITCHKGKATKKATRHLGSTGKAATPKLPSKGTWKCTANYAGAGVYKKSSKSFTVRVR